MDNPHLARHGAKRPRLQENANVLTTSVSTFQCNSDAIITFLKSKYENMSQEKLALEIQQIENQGKYEELEEKADDLEQKSEVLQLKSEELQNKVNDLQKKNEELQEKHEALEEAHQSLQLLSNNQNSRISQLPTEIEVSRLNEAIARMESEAKRHIRKVADLEKARETDKAKIAEVEKAQEDARQTFEKEKKAFKERLEQHMKALKESYEKECARLRQNIAELNVNNKNRDQMASNIAVMEQSIALPSNVLSDTTLLHSSIAHSEMVSSFPNQSAVFNDTNAPDDLLVINKLVHKRLGIEWDAYFSMDENETPTDLYLSGPDLLINEEIVSKKLVLDGILTQFKDDPFASCTRSFNGNYCKFVSRLLQEFVCSCKLTDLFLQNQLMSWLDYEKLVSDGNVKNLYLSHVSIKTENGTIALLEEVMEKLPHIQRLGCVFRSSGSIKLTKQTFTKLPTFENLNKFCLYGIVFGSFDGDSYIAFMKKHLNAQFTLIFRYHELSVNEKAEVKTIAEKLRKTFPLSSKLEIHLMSSRSKFAIAM